MNYIAERFLLLAAGLFSVSILNAQDQLILTSGDTLNGEIEILLPDTRYEEIIIDADGDKTRYKSYEFISFTSDSTEYRTIKYGDKYRIMEVVSDGYLSQLKFRLDESYSFNTAFLHKRAGDGIEVPNFMFKKALGKFLDECASIREAIDEGTYKKRNIDELVEAYNACMDDLTENRMEASRKEEIIEETSPLANEFTTLRNQAAEMDDNEMVSMLDDIIGKLTGAEPVPNYLKNALTAHVRDGHPLKKETEELLLKL